MFLFLKVYPGGSGPGQGKSAGYEITDGNPTKGRPRGRPVRQWIDEVPVDDYWKDTIWQMLAQERQMWKQHAEAFAQPRDTMTAQCYIYIYPDNNNFYFPL